MTKRIYQWAVVTLALALAVLIVRYNWTAETPAVMTGVNGWFVRYALWEYPTMHECEAATTLDKIKNSVGLPKCVPVNSAEGQAAIFNRHEL